MLRKLILVLMTVLMILSINLIAQAQTLPTEEDIIELFPNAAKVDGVGTYLFTAKSVAVGPSYTIVRFYNLVNGDISFASIAKGGSYVGAGASTYFADIVKKFGRDPADILIAFNPSVGVTVGYRSSVGDIKAGVDGGIQVKLLNVDTAKIAAWFGL